MEGGALWRVGEFPDELVYRRREGELVASERDAGVTVVVGDVLNAEAGDACEWLAVEEDEEPSDTCPELEVVVVQEPSDEAQAIVVGELRLPLVEVACCVERHGQLGLARPSEEPFDLASLDRAFG